VTNILVSVVSDTLRTQHKFVRGILKVKNVSSVDYWRSLGAASCYLLIAILSSVPGELRPHIPGLSDKLEHFLAFLILGAVTVLTSPRPFSGRRSLAVVVAYAAVLEAGQFFVPGRVASLMDLAASSAGALVGVTLALPVRRFPAMAVITWRDRTPPLPPA
jgi:VanZ family protein